MSEVPYSCMNELQIRFQSKSLPHVFIDFDESLHYSHFKLTVHLEMASGIPPLLPASPPPMCKDDFNEVESDDSANEDNDEFGDFSVATPDNLSNKPTNDVLTFNVIEPTILETNSTDAFKIPSTEHESVITNSSLQETQSDDEKSTAVNSNTEEPVDELKSSTDDDTIINSFVTVEMPSMADPVFDSPPLDAETSNRESTMNDDSTNDPIFDHEIAPVENDFTINSPSASDSDSIDIPDDSFIICDETNSNHVSDFLTASENSGKKDDPIFGEFVSNKNNVTSDFQVEHKSHVLPDAVSTDPTVFDTDFETEFRTSDDFFQPFADVSTPLPNEKVTKLELDDVFGAETNDPLKDPLSTNTETTQHSSQAVEIAPVQFSCEFDDDDDDFSDFVSPTTFVQSKMIEDITCDPLKIQPNKIENVPTSFSGMNDFPMDDKCLFEQDELSTTSEKLNWTEIFCAPTEDHIEVNVNSIEGKLKCSSVWCKIKDIENSPALHYNWNDSDTNKLLLATLCVDSRNILFGPRWSSEVPRFASNLGFTPLVPQKAADKSPQNEFPDLCNEVIPEIVAPFTESNPTMSSVPDAHFDWNNSGLTNPLDSYSHSSLLDLDLLASFDIHSPYYRKKSKPEKSTVSEDYELQNSVSILNGAETKTLSPEAANILNSLPNLVVMEKQYIVFPIR